MGETWLPIVGYEGLYEVSDRGNIRSLFRYKKQLKPSEGNNGYLSVELFKNKQGKRFSIHRLVAMAFIPNPENFPQINHKDENKHNNCADNLEWCSAQYNMNFGVGGKTRHLKIDYSKPVYAENARKNAIKQSRPVEQFEKNGEFIQSFSSGKAASIATGINHSHIMECCSEKLKTAGGFVWKYRKEE